MTVKELSQYIKLKEKTIYYLISKRSVPHYRIGKLVRFKSEEIDLWLESKKAKSFEKQFSKITKSIYNAIEGRSTASGRG